MLCAMFRYNLTPFLYLYFALHESGFLSNYFYSYSHAVETVTSIVMRLLQSYARDKL